MSLGRVPQRVARTDSSWLDRELVDHLSRLIHELHGRPLGPYGEAAVS